MIADDPWQNGDNLEKLSLTFAAKCDYISSGS